jgi:hypothetical protein
MVVLLFNLVMVGVVSLLSLIPFNDAANALKEGVLSATSTMGYSVTRSVFLYVAGAGCAVAVSFLFTKLFKSSFIRQTPQALEQKPLVIPRLQKKEYIFLGIIIVLCGIANITFRERIFDANAIHTEEFYNLSALNEVKQESFSIIYPYSAGNLLIASVLRTAGVSLVYYKIFLNFLAIILGYCCLAVFIKRVPYRFLACLWLFGFYFFLSAIGPTLHANNLRFLLPVGGVVLLFHYANAYARYYAKRLAALSTIFAGFLFFGSADTIAIFLVVYGLFSVYHMLQSSGIKEKVVFIVAPGIGVLSLGVLFGANYVNIALNQFRSILFYSGHANALPYLSVFTILHSTSPLDVVKNGIYTIISYAPFVIFANLILYLVSVWQKKEDRFKESFAVVVLLFTVYFLYYRQSFANAGAGRIVTASGVLVFLLLAIKKYYRPTLMSKIIISLGIIFFCAHFLVSSYFLRYNLQYLYRQYVAIKTVSEEFVPCSQTFLKENLDFAGFTYCRKDLIEELSRLKTVLGGQPFYVSDDTFSLYYLMDARPIVLIPSYYMAYSKQRILLDTIKNEKVEYIVTQPKRNVFGVPDAFLDDPRFMRVINEYQKNHFKKTISIPGFTLFQVWE